MNVDWANWVLVVVGAVTGIAVWRQANESAKATRAMERSTSAFVISQQPIVNCEPIGHPLSDLTESVPRMRLGISNKGLTTAFNCQHETWIEFVPHAVGSDYDFVDTFTFSESATREVSPDCISLYPNTDPIVVNIPAGKPLSADDKAAIKRAQLLVCVRLRLTFSDSFSVGPRFSDFAFLVLYGGMRFLPKYHKSN